MGIGDLGPHLLALLVFPGGLLTLALGAVGEASAAMVLDRVAPRAALLAPVVALRRAALNAPLLLIAALLLATLAATQLAVPLSPVAPVERNLVVATMALAAAALLAGARDWAAPDARRALVAQASWMAALLAPALLSETLRPQALGAIAVPADVPLKAVAALLALLCLPELLRTTPDAPPIRCLLWLPLCGLFASVFFPPGEDDLAGLLWFLAVTAGTAVVTMGLLLLNGRSRAVTGAYPRLLVLLAAAVLVIAAVTSATT